MDKEYVMRGNAAILKCSIPSFVADFVYVTAWVDDEGTEIVTTDDYAESKGIGIMLVQVLKKPRISNFSFILSPSFKASFDLNLI